MNVGHHCFHVSMPPLNIALLPRMFSNTEDMNKVCPDQNDEPKAVVGTIVDQFPTADLVMQRDRTTELQNAYRKFTDLPAKLLIDCNLEQF